VEIERRAIDHLPDRLLVWLFGLIDVSFSLRHWQFDGEGERSYEMKGICVCVYAMFGWWTEHLCHVVINFWYHPIKKIIHFAHFLSSHAGSVCLSAYADDDDAEKRLKCKVLNVLWVLRCMSGSRDIVNQLKQFLALSTKRWWSYEFLMWESIKVIRDRLDCTREKFTCRCWELRAAVACDEWQKLNQVFFSIPFWRRLFKIADWKSQFQDQTNAATMRTSIQIYGLSEQLSSVMHIWNDDNDSKLELLMVFTEMRERSWKCKFHSKLFLGLVLKWWSIRATPGCRLWIADEKFEMNLRVIKY